MLFYSLHCRRMSCLILQSYSLSLKSYLLIIFHLCQWWDAITYKSFNIMCESKKLVEIWRPSKVISELTWNKLCGYWEVLWEDVPCHWSRTSLYCLHPPLRQTGSQNRSKVHRSVNNKMHSKKFTTAEHTEELTVIWLTFACAKASTFHNNKAPWTLWECVAPSQHC